MKLVDANILLYTVNENAPLHKAAQDWLDSSLSSTETVAFAWNALLSFVRISTRAGVFTRPLSIKQALDIVDLWVGQPFVTIVHPAQRHAHILRELLNPTGTAGNLVPDAHLAALAIEHNATLYSFDNDFARFRGLRWVNPLT